MVFFCPECLHSLGINKKVSQNIEKKILDKVDDFLKLFISNKFDFNSFQLGFSKDELIRNKKYSKLSSSDKYKIDLLFTSSVNNAELSCDNCGYKSDILETIKVYEYNVSDEVRSVRSLDDNKLLTKDPILPRTRDYTCKKVDCPTNDPKKKGINKEAVWIRNQKNFGIEYICTVCYSSWS